MSVERRGRMLVALATGSVLLGLVPALAQQLDVAFMPKGGKTLLIEALGQNEIESSHGVSRGFWRALAMIHRVAERALTEARPRGMLSRA